MCTANVPGGWQKCATASTSAAAKHGGISDRGEPALLAVSDGLFSRGHFGSRR
jgi:hypothetical protein